MQIGVLVRTVVLAVLMAALTSGSASAERWTFENSQDPMNDTAIRIASLERGQGSVGERGILIFACRADGVVRALIALALFDPVFGEDRVTYRFDSHQPQSDIWHGSEGGRMISGDSALAFLGQIVAAQERLVFRSEGTNRQLVFGLPAQPEFAEFATQCRSWVEAAQVQRQSSPTPHSASGDPAAQTPVAPPAPQWAFSADRTALEDADRRFASLEVDGPERFEKSFLGMLCADNGALVLSVQVGRMDFAASNRSRTRRATYRIDEQPPREENWEKPDRGPGNLLFDRQAISLMRDISSARQRFVFRNDRGAQMTFTWDMSQAQQLQQFVAQCVRWSRVAQRPQQQPARPQGEQPRR